MTLCLTDTFFLFLTPFFFSFLGVVDVFSIFGFDTAFGYAFGRVSPKETAAEARNHRNFCKRRARRSGSRKAPPCIARPLLRENRPSICPEKASGKLISTGKI
jgi:hypothetical protein